MKEFHLTFCLHTTHFRIEPNPETLNPSLNEIHARDGFPEELDLS
jgi:hypothetical protein